MTIGWQDILAGTVVVGAACYLVWRGWQVLARRKAGCGTCANCSSERRPSEPQVVSISTKGHVGKRQE